MPKDYLDQPHSEGYFSVEEYELYYRRFGSGDRTLLTLHGGPGMPHDYLVPLADLAGSDRSVYMYDQYGVGRSDKPAPGDFDRYTVKHYRDEVDQVREAIGAETIDIYGQSWGGMLALEYVLEYPDRVNHLILANTLADTATAFESMRSVIEELPEDTQQTIKEYEANRAYDADVYEEALDAAYRQHVCRLDEYPGPVLETFENVNLDIYGLMWGPNEYVLQETARLRGWDVRDRLDEITVHTLVLTGSYDEISPAIARDIADRIQNSELIEFEESSHMPFWEQPEVHHDAVESFLSNSDR